MRTEPKCPDLRAFAESNRLRWQRAAEQSPAGQDPWLWEIPCKKGVLYPQGPSEVAYMTTSTTQIKACQTDPRFRLHQRGDREASFIIPFSELSGVLSMLKVKRRRKVTPERAEAMKAHLAKVRERCQEARKGV